MRLCSVDLRHLTYFIFFCAVRRGNVVAGVRHFLDSVTQPLHGASTAEQRPKGLLAKRREGSAKQRTFTLFDPNQKSFRLPHSSEAGSLRPTGLCLTHYG